MSQSQPISLWLVRHGQTEQSAAGCYSGWSDIPLTAEGERQAKEVAARLAAQPFDQGLASTAPRAQRTAELIGAGPVRPEPLAREWNFGAYDGRTQRAIQAEVPGWTAWTHPAMPGGEHLDEVTARADLLLERLVGGAARRGLLVSPRSFLRILAARWVGQDTRFGAHLVIGTARLGVLSVDRGRRVIERWNA
jgi:broad specificity phosphatase PhoE